MAGTTSRKQQAIDLRRAGLSRSQIAATMGLPTTGSLSKWLKGVPAPEWTRRPRAKDDLRERAVSLRREGKSYREIAGVVPVSTSTLSVWLRDVHLTEEHRRAIARRSRAAAPKRADSIRAARIRRNLELQARARQQIVSLSDQELFVAGVVAYWAEGAKNRPWGGRRRVTFVNSDPGLIRLFLEWLSLMGVDDDRLLFRVYIHESADVTHATRFWSTVVGVAESDIKVSFKRPNPETNRRNLVDYRGCLVVTVRRSAELNIRISGWCDGLAAAATRPGTIAARSGVV